MPGSSFGQLFRITTFGESHGPGIGVVIDGVPAGCVLERETIQEALDRRRPGQSDLVSPRKESDRVQVLSGLFEGRTTGAPLALWIANEDQRPADYDLMEASYRPSHADYTWEQKFGLRDHRGGGRSSARETAARVAAGAVAQRLLADLGVEIRAYVQQIGEISIEEPAGAISLGQVEASPVRCPDPVAAARMIALVESVREEGDTLGGIVGIRITGCPAGWGEPVFDKLHADLAKAVMSINACKGFEVGSGFRAAGMRGSAHNDVFEQEGGRVRTRTNYSGGVQGGISNGMPIVCRAAFKPVATIRMRQETIDREGRAVHLEAKGRHDPCVLPRAVPIVEAMCAIVLADHYLRSLANQWNPS